MSVIIDEIEKKPADCSVCDLCIRDEEGKHYCAVNADWVYPYGESVNLDCPVKNYEKLEWIPVSERLPDEAGKGVLVTAVNMFGQKNKFIAFQGYGDFKWHTETNTYTNDPSSTNTEVGERWKILAWMPLPEPYEPEEDSEDGN